MSKTFGFGQKHLSDKRVRRVAKMGSGRMAKWWSGTLKAEQLSKRGSKR